MESNRDLDEEKLIRFANHCRWNPLLYVQTVFPWKQPGDLADSTGPRQWQEDEFRRIGAHLSDVNTRYAPLLISIASGHGIGKSAFISMLLSWGMSTCADTKCVVTANTDNQLRTKTWPEIKKWQRMADTSHWFETTATAVVSSDKEHNKTWRADAIPWSDNATEAFAGLHNKGKRLILIFDEASAISDKIWEVAEGALTDEHTEIIWIAFGNPTQNTGRFRECFGKFKHRWQNRRIDSRKVEGTNKEQIQKWIDDYGEDSDFVRVRVKGEFPRAGSMQFISGDVVEAARKREPYAKLSDPVVMGVDVARFGDDESVIVIRRGRDAKTIPWMTMRGADTMTLAARIVDLAQQYKPDMIFVDEGGVGGGVVDRLNMLRQPVIGIQFGAAADRAVQTGEGALTYMNKAAEMWGYMRDWLKGASIPDDPDLAEQLVGRQYGYGLKDGKDAIMLEKKKDMKKRGLSSPDKADALCLTFAYPVVPSDHTGQMTQGRTGQHQVAYDPLNLQYVNRDLGTSNNHQVNYDPLGIDYLKR